MRRRCAIQHRRGAIVTNNDHREDAVGVCWCEASIVHEQCRLRCQERAAIQVQVDEHARNSVRQIVVPIWPMIDTVTPRSCSAALKPDKLSREPAVFEQLDRAQR